MIHLPLPTAFAEIFHQVHEAGDQVAVITPTGHLSGVDLPADSFFSEEDWQKERVPEGSDLVIFLDILPRLSPAAAGQVADGLARAVRPGGMLFLGAWTTDHPSWKTPAPGWQKSGTRALHHPGTDETRFFLHDDEIISLFAAWNILHHTESSTGQIEIVLLRPEARTVDVSTSLYEG